MGPSKIESAAAGSPFPSLLPGAHHLPEDRTQAVGIMQFLASLLQMVLLSCVALGKTPALLEHCVFVPCSLTPVRKQFTVEGEKWIMGLGDNWASS